MIGEGIHGNNFQQSPSMDSWQSLVNQREPYKARPFLSRHSDLDLNFGENFRPVLITRLLISCLYRDEGTGFSEQEIWHWSLMERLQGILSIVFATSGRHLRQKINCKKPDCKELFEVEIDLACFIRNEPITHFVCRPEPHMELELRLPTGIDQLKWINKKYDMKDNLFSEMASSLVSKVNGERPHQRFRLSDEWIDHIGTELEKQDDLTDLVINTNCPACSEEPLFDLDLEEKLLEILLKKQKLLFRQIHGLALAYHWSEKDIVEMSDQRRQYYLAQIDEGSFHE